MKLNLGADIDIGHTISVGKAERCLVLNIRRHTFEATTRHGVFTCVYQRDTPRLGMALVHLHLVVGHVKRDVGHMQKVVGKVLFDQVALVAD